MRHRGAAHVFVADLAAPVLTSDDAHHLSRVLRLRAGEPVTASDGAGGYRLCAFADHDALEPLGGVEHDDAPAVAVTVAFALTKADKPELAVQKLTELGVDRIVPLAAARSVVQWDAAKAARNVERWRAVAHAAAMQSRRVFLPEVADVTPLGALAGDGVVLAEADGGRLDAAIHTIAVGPEGGWTDEELAAVPRHVDLGPTTLRAETAAVAAGVLLTALRDGRLIAGGGR
ncbi:MAG TPA: RsmE family RNA methyltransferase [Acidimicrobiales bacterium]|nr:RsmE family RNA methyltransferase [Acidimicrobiales bacterium]